MVRVGLGVYVPNLDMTVLSVCVYVCVCVCAA